MKKTDLEKKKEAKSKRLYNTYGITYDEYKEQYTVQKGKCLICDRKYEVLNVDHRHIPKYKKLSPELKKQEVRGLLCMRCNKFTVGGLEIHKNAREALHRMVAYFLIYPTKGDL